MLRGRDKEWTCFIAFGISCVESPTRGILQRDQTSDITFGIMYGAPWILNPQTFFKIAYMQELNYISIRFWHLFTDVSIIRHQII